MAKRIRQFVSAVTAKITETDIAFIQQHLNRQERHLFWAMSVPEQSHSLNVAYTALKLAQTEPKVDAVQLIKCALLHDVGKRAGDISTVDKIVTVLADKLAPNWARRWGKAGRGNKIRNLRHAFHFYFYHAQYSAERLIEIGLPDIAEIVRKHHEAPTNDDLPELRLLRKADDAN